MRPLGHELGAVDRERDRLTHPDVGERSRAGRIASRRSRDSTVTFGSASSRSMSESGTPLIDVDLLVGERVDQARRRSRTCGTRSAAQRRTAGGVRARRARTESADLATTCHVPSATPSLATFGSRSGSFANTCAGTTCSRSPGAQAARELERHLHRRSSGRRARCRAGRACRARTASGRRARGRASTRRRSAVTGLPSDHARPRPKVVDPAASVGRRRPPDRDAGRGIERLRVERGERRVLEVPHLARDRLSPCRGSSEPMVPSVPTVSRSGSAAPRGDARADAAASATARTATRTERGRAPTHGATASRRGRA